ncbi:lysophospholipid acyltransferase family protein [Roseomonas marmotae]|uniref:1-acyl-sn-glycerol-3-phosphate acyltransferase n=1 Tax=Roseomonas marmotae TaxID=2768161 RepID=A0ABS3K730_9PROT|nr:lysophospholipid acyltransferase family protein [Roseomonas marmotae]MBO1073261.1 1-acyl-sn-glycerol-3-phosphate acyltransferase [Roseomonas marmotae]QTI79115.1 1-acyl-sn-glycerol-3-phosphate acyltransferase [Roseomonas marmotae]
MTAATCSQNGSPTLSAAEGAAARRPLLVGMPDDSPLSRGSRLRASVRLVLGICWTLLCIPVQAVLVMIPGLTGAGRGKILFGGFYHRVLCRILGLRVRVIGQRVDQGAGARGSVLFLSNHSSWLDIPVLGAVLQAPFVSKAEVGSWPGINIVARLGRTVYVSRTRGRTGEEASEMQARLAAGDNLLLFPEGTSSDGSRVLPFRSSFLAVAGAATLVQPVSVVYDQLGGLPAVRRDRAVFAWYGDMDIGTHFWRLARRSGGRVTVLLHEPMDPRDFPNRKALTAAVEKVVAEGAAALRQGRPARPLPPPVKNA